MPFTDVRDHGARGDDSADDHGAISRAVAACPPGGSVYFPPGIYRVSRPIEIPGNVRLLGDGNTKYPQYAGVQSCLKPYFGRFDGASLLRADGSHGWIIEGLNLLGVGATSTSGAPVDAIRAEGGCKGARLRSLTVWNFTGHGVHTRNTATSRPGGWEVEGLFAFGCKGHGWYGADPGRSRIASSDNRFHNCEASANARDGWHFEGLTTTSMFGVWACWNAGHGFEVLRRAASLSLTECQTDRNGKDGIRLVIFDEDGERAPAPRAVLMTACTVNRDRRTGLSVEGASADALAPYVVVTGLSLRTGVDDDGTGPRTPEVGVLSRQCRGVILSGSVVSAATPYLKGPGGRIQDAGGNVFVSVDAATGALTYGPISGTEL